MAESISETSATVLAMGPKTESGNQADGFGQIGTRPVDGLRPTTLQKLAGFLRDPPKSDPSARGTRPDASAAAAPPLEPPHVFSKSYGFRVAPKTLLKVWLPAPNSGVLVLPTVTAPDCRSLSTINASWSGMKSANKGDPKVVRMPLVTVKSLCATGSPSNKPNGAFLMIR